MNEKGDDKMYKVEFDKTEQNIRKEETLKYLLEALNKSTEEIYELKQKEVNLLQRLLDTEQAVTHLINELAKQKFPIEKQVSKK